MSNLNDKINSQNLSPEEINLISRSCSALPNAFAFNNDNDGQQKTIVTAVTSMNTNAADGSSNRLAAVNATYKPGCGSRTTTPTNAKPSSPDCSTNHKITRMLLLMSFSYAILNLPYFISWCIFFYRVSVNPKLTRATKYYVFSAINLCEIFYVLNYGVHFFIYCASGKKFREQLRSAFASSK